MIFLLGIGTTTKELADFSQSISIIYIIFNCNFWIGDWEQNILETHKWQMKKSQKKYIIYPSSKIFFESLPFMGTEVQWLQLAPLDPSERKEPPGSGPCVKEARLILGVQWKKNPALGYVLPVGLRFVFFGVDPTSPTIWMGLGLKSEGLRRETCFQIQAHTGSK